MSVVMNSAIRNLITILLCLQFCCGTSGVYALAPIDDEVLIDSLTNDIVHKEIDLERYYLQYRVHGTKEPKWRRARFFGLQVSSALCGLSSNIVQIGLSGSHIKDPENISLKGTRQGLEVGLVGILLDGGSSVVELCSNGFTAFKNIKNGTSPGAAVKNVVARIKVIDAQIDQRDLLVAKHPELAATQLYQAEGRVLRSFRDWCLSEFADVYADVKSSQASANVYYALDIAADSVYLASQILAIKSVTDDSHSIPSTNSGMVGDCLGIASAPVSTKSYNVMYKFWRNRLGKRLQEDLKKSEDETKVAMDKLNQVLASKDVAELEATGSVQNRISVYLLWSARYDEFIQQGLIDQRHQNKVALQGELSGPAISGTYLTQDILSSVALREFARRPKAQNNLYLAGSIAAATGTATSLALTNYWLFDQICYRRKMKAKGMLPEQLLAARLQTLDELDARIVSSSR